MTDAENPFSELDVQQAIDLRWTLRDIKAKRWKLSPINPSHLEKLIAKPRVPGRDGEKQAAQWVWQLIGFYIFACQFVD